jgi:hypothetical protein
LLDETRLNLRRHQLKRPLRHTSLVDDQGVLDIKRGETSRPKRMPLLCHMRQDAQGAIQDQAETLTPLETEVTAAPGHIGP